MVKFPTKLQPLNASVVCSEFYWECNGTKKAKKATTNRFKRNGTNFVVFWRRFMICHALAQAAVAAAACSHTRIWEFIFWSWPFWREQRILVFGKSALYQIVQYCSLNLDTHSDVCGSNKEIEEQSEENFRMHFGSLQSFMVQIIFVSPARENSTHQNRKEANEKDKKPTELGKFHSIKFVYAQIVSESNMLCAALHCMLIKCMLRKLLKCTRAVTSIKFNCRFKLSGSGNASFDSNQTGWRRFLFILISFHFLELMRLV